MPDRPHEQPPIEDRTDGPRKRRLHISVPSPMARMNLGMPWFERLRGTRYEDPRNIPRFGYKGLSMQTDSYLFIDIHKDALISVEKSMQLQTGKEWLQYSSGSTWLATEMDATVATQDRLTLVAGAGQGHRRHIDHGLALSLDAYNNLHLHYRVDSVMMGVYEFMTGRRERVPNVDGVLPSELDSKKDRLSRPQPGAQSSNRLDRGMYETMKEAETLLGPGLPQLEGLLGAFDKDPDDGWYGYGKRYFTSFDPYEMKSPSVPNGGAEFVIRMKNALTVTRRVMDVALHVGTALNNLPVLRQVGQLANALSRASDFVGKLDSIGTQFGAYPESNPDRVRHRGESGDDFDIDEPFREFVDAIASAEASSRRRATLTLSPPPISSPTVGALAPFRAWTLPPGPGLISGWIRTETRDESPTATIPNVQISIGLLPTLTAEDLEATLVASAGGAITVSVADDVVTIVSNTDSRDGRYSSYLSLGGELFEVLAGGTLTDAVPRTDVANASDDLGHASSVMNALGRPLGDVLSSDNAYVKLCQDVAGCFSDTVKALDELGGIVGDAFTAPSPPSMIGLFARDGITLGTTDRVVSAAGKGYLFFADGGTGSRDHHKFSTDIERTIGELSDGGAGGVGDIGADHDTDIGAEIPGTSGFTVLSNSSASILTRSALDLFALGTELRGGGDEIVGRGVARLGATRSVEVTAHRHVVIAATGGATSEPVALPLAAQRSDPGLAAQLNNPGVAMESDHPGQANDRAVSKVQRGSVTDSVKLPPLPLGVQEDEVPVESVVHGPAGGEVSILGETIRLGSVLRSHVVQPVSTTVAWPSDEIRLADELHQFAFERSVGAATEQVEVQAKTRVDLLSHPYSLRVAPNGILLSGQPAREDQGALAVPSGQDARTRVNQQAQRAWSEAKSGADSLLAYATRMHSISADSYAQLNTPYMWHRTYAGLGFKEWKKLKDYYGELKSKADREIQHLGNSPNLDPWSVGDEDFPALQMNNAEIRLGFMKSGRWTSYLKITPDRIEMKHSADDVAGLAVTQGTVTQTGRWCGSGVACEP